MFLRPEPDVPIRVLYEFSKFSLLHGQAIEDFKNPINRIHFAHLQNVKFPGVFLFKLTKPEFFRKSY